MTSDKIILILLLTSGVSSQVMRWNSLYKRLTIIRTPDFSIKAGALAEYPEVRVNTMRGRYILGKFSQKSSQNNP